MSGPYEDIIQLPHHTSPTRPRMSMSDRAAQFSPFAALTGYEAAIQETGRLTETRLLLTEDELEILNRKYCLLEDSIRTGCDVIISYFLPDNRKDGGAYCSVCGIVKKIDLSAREIYMTNGTVIQMDDVADITVSE